MQRWWTLGKILLLSVVLTLIGSVVPLAAQAATDEMAKPVASDPLDREAPADLHPGDWTVMEPWASMLEGIEAGSDYQLSSTHFPPIFWYDDLESGGGGWTHTGSWAITEEWGGYGHSPTHSWSDSPGGNYLNNQDMYLYSPVIDVSALGAAGKSASLMFNLRVDTEGAYIFPDHSVYLSDYVQYSVTNIPGFWDVREEYYGLGEGYVSEYFWPWFLDGVFQVRFRFKSDESVTYDGVHIDDLAIVTQADEGLLKDDSRLTYLGEWGAELIRPSLDHVHYVSDVPGSAVVLSFNGTGVNWSAGVGPDYGVAKVSLDGGPPMEIDQYSPKYVGDARTMFKSWTIWGNLPDGPHTLVVWGSGEKNPASSDYRLSSYYFSVWGTTVDAPRSDLRQEDDTNLEYLGPWAPTSDPAAHAGALTLIDSPGSSVNVAFEGNYLTWIGKKGPGYGKAKVSLDGGPLQTVDLYHAWDSSRRALYNTGWLSDGPHTLAIYCSGEKNAASTGISVNADAFSVVGSLTDAGPAPAWRYQQTDSRLTYLGSWTTSGTDWSASGGSYAGTSQTGAAVLAKFNGTEVTVLARTAPWYGEGEIYIDDVLQDTVDLYSSAVAYKVPIYFDDTLPAGEHTLAVVCKGTKNGSSSGLSISLDALDIAGYMVQADTPTRYEQDDPSLDYQGPWVMDCPSPFAASGWSYSYADKPGSSTRVAFTGTYLTWVARTTPWSGKAKVVLDAGTGSEQVTMVDTWSSADKHKQKVYSTGLIADGAHTLDIYWTGEKNPSSWYSTVYTDAFDVLGTIQAAGPAPAIEWTYQQDDPRLAVVGAWSTASSSSASGGSYARTVQPGASVIAKFTGTEVTPVFCTGPTYGEVKLTLDPGTAGEDVQTIDLYSATAGWKVTGLYVKTGLADTVHTLVIENASTGGEPIVLDGFDIIGYLGEALTKVDDKDYAHFAYDPGIASAGASTSEWSRWDDSGYWAAYEDTYAYTDKVGHKVTFTFDGTYAAWIACTSNTKGKAQVTVDGDTAGAKTVDLYSPTTLWKQKVFDTGLLADGPHTIEIECLGTKNWASWYHTIDVDRFDVILAP